MTDDNQQPPIETPEPIEKPEPAPKPNEELSAAMAKLKAAEERALQAEQQIKSREMQDLTKNNEWQKVAEIKEKEANEHKTKYEGLKEALVRREKYNALAQAALASGIRKEAISDLSLVDLKELKVETTNEGDVTVSGADKMVNKLKTLKPHWFQSQTPNVNPKSPSATSSSTQNNWDALKKAEAEYKKNPSKANETAYREVLLAYRK
jgi:hypothetical protein